MLLGCFRRPSRLARSRLRLGLLILGGLLIIDSFLIILNHPPSRRVTLSSYAAPAVQKDKIFIAAIHRNTEWILRTHWTEAVLNLTKHFGPKNVYVSVQESGSLDDTKGALRDLDFELKELGVHRNIVLGLTLEEQIDEVSTPPEREEGGWIRTSRGKIELRRIPYLAKLRNKVMEKLVTEAEAGRTYDTILWLNDVVFTVRSQKGQPYHVKPNFK